MKTHFLILVLFMVAGFFLVASPVEAGPRESETVASAMEVLEAQAAIPAQGIPASLLRDAKGIAIIPGVLKAGFVVGGRHGRGIVLVRQADGSWGDPGFVSLTGGSLGWQIGVQSTDIVLVFETTPGLNRILSGKGKLTLGADVAVAAGPVGRQAEAATDGQLRAEIYSYSRSRGLFAGVSVEGAALMVDGEANRGFYTLVEVRPGQKGLVPDREGAVLIAKLKSQVAAMSGNPPQPVVIYPPQVAPSPPVSSPPPPPVTLPYPTPLPR